MTSENKEPIPEAVVNQILNQSKIVEVINDFQPLSVTDELITGICPFCGGDEFTINEDKNFFHCFDCEESGTSLSYLMHTQNFEFSTAIDYLGKKQGLMLYR